MHCNREDLTRQNRRPIIEPRGLSRNEAAEYIGVSPSLFDETVKDGRMPSPIRINSRTVWDRKQVDEAFEALKDQPDDRLGAANKRLKALKALFAWACEERPDIARQNPTLTVHKIPYASS